MIAVFFKARKRLAQFVMIAAFPILAACDQVAFNGPALNTQDPVQVALLVPQSAAEGGATLAASFENAARLAATDLAEVQIDLRVYDTGGDPAQAASVAGLAVNDGAKIIIGPLFAESAAAAGLAVANRGINVLTFSNNPSVAGGNVYLLGSTFQSAADRLVGHAVRNGRGSILIAQGNSSAEASASAAIQRAIATQGGSLAGLATFELNQQAVIEAIPEIAGQVEATGAASLFMTSGNDGAVGFLAELLPENGVDPANTQFIGIQRLDVPTSALSVGGLQGSWFALPDPALTEQFRARYQAAFGEPPHPLAGLAYDGVAAIGALVSTGQPDALGAVGLTNPGGFAGVNGIFRFLPNGTNERGLAVAQIQEQQVVIIDPAPRSFGGAGL